MKLVFLGVGSAFAPAGFYQSNMYLEDDYKNRLSIDCGSDFRHSAKIFELDYSSFDNFFISHLHADHAGGLEYIGFCRYFDKRFQKPNLIISEFLSSKLWQNTLSGGMLSIQGKIANLETYFNVLPVGPNGSFKWNNIEFRLVQTIHVMNGFQIEPSFGLLFEVNGKKIFITTDTQFCPNQIQDFYRMADLIFHDCETAPYKSGVHAHYEDLKQLPKEIKNKMWLYHYQPCTINAKQDDFLGFVQPRQIFEL